MIANYTGIPLAIRIWVSSVGETDPLLINDYMDNCRNDSEAMNYFLGRARTDEVSAAAILIIALDTRAERVKALADVPAYDRAEVERLVREFYGDRWMGRL